MKGSGTLHCYVKTCNDLLCLNFGFFPVNNWHVMSAELCTYWSMGLSMSDNVACSAYSGHVVGDMEASNVNNCSFVRK